MPTLFLMMLLLQQLQAAQARPPLPPMEMKEQPTIKNPTLPPIQWINYIATSLTQLIIMKVSTTTAGAIYPLNSIWDDDKVEKYKD